MSSTTYSWKVVVTLYTVLSGGSDVERTVSKNIFHFVNNLKAATNQSRMLNKVITCIRYKIKGS